MTREEQFKKFLVGFLRLYAVEAEAFFFIFFLPWVYMMCKPPSLCRLSLPSSILVVVNALRRRPPVNKSDRRRARVTSKSH